MNPFSFLASILKWLPLAVGQVFAWLNRRAQTEQQKEINERIAEAQRAAARPNRENADRLNRWLVRGRSGRLRNRRR